MVLMCDSLHKHNVDKGLQDVQVVLVRNPQHISDGGGGEQGVAESMQREARRTGRALQATTYLVPKIHKKTAMRARRMCTRAHCCTVSDRTLENLS